jgi:acetyl esterase/lipase
MEATAHLLPFPQAPDGVELRHLRAFVAVAEELNFGRAAERLYVSQPALSRQIRALEQVLGVELLRRSTHRVELTVAGEALLERARRLLRDVDEAVAETMAVGGELLARIAKQWEPLRGLVAGENDLHEARAAYEQVQAQFSPPPGTSVQPATAGGVPSLLVSTATAGVADRSAPSVLYLHGGGYVLGSAFGYQAHAGALAAAAQTSVLLPDYRLAPEHSFPAAVEDSLSAYRWMLERSSEPERIVIAGDSAGGGLVMSVLLTLKRDGSPMPGAAILFCPFVDLSLRLEGRHTGTSAPLASLAEVQRCLAAYLAGHPADDPILDPLGADLSGLPPMLIQAATGDAQLADAQALAARAREHGVDARLALYPVDAHDFQLFWSFLPEAADAMEAAGAFVRARRAGTVGVAAARS